jgi:hypothetical protein
MKGENKMQPFFSGKAFKYWVVLLALGLFVLLPAPVSLAAEVVSAPAGFSTSQDALNYYLELVETLDVTTGIGKSVFYSGPGNRKLAEQFAESDDKTTLEMTTGGKYLDDLKLFEKGSPLTPDMAVRVWSRLSQRYAQQAAGDVFCFIAGARPTGVFTTVELPELKRSRKVGVMYSVSSL